MAEKIIADRTINLDSTQTIALETDDIRQAYVLVNEGNEIDVDKLAAHGCAVGEDGKIIVGAPCYRTQEELDAASSFDHTQVTPVEDVTHQAEITEKPKRK